MSTVAQQKKWREKNPERARARHYRAQAKFRGYPEPTRKKPEACENCNRVATGKGLMLDHDHVTGQFRGWLCNRCNLGIGSLDDSIEGIERALEYLKRARLNS